MRPPAPPDLSTSRRVHVVAVGGAGMSAIATVLAQRGHRVSGSDRAAGPALGALRDEGVRVGVGHDAANVEGADMVVVSTAVPSDNVEVRRAEELGIPVLGRIDVLSALARDQGLLSVSGTHGKTTTSAMLATCLVGTGADPSYIIGAPVPALGAAAAAGHGEWFVLEADESDGSFLAAPRAAAVVTNLEADHLEFWGGWRQLRDAVEEFLAGTDGPRVVCADDPVAAELGSRTGALTYGLAPSAGVRLDALRADGGGSRFDLVRVRGGREQRTAVRLAVPGVHNALDAAAALSLVDELGADLRGAVGALGDFDGAARRFDRRGSAAGVEVVDDYAHLPTEIRAALAAGRSTGCERLLAVFQPHRYSRTEALRDEFATCFDDADVVVITEIHAAGEAPRPGVDGRSVLDAARAARPGADLRWAPTLDAAVALLVDEVRPGDLVMSIGAGDVTALADRLLPRLAEGAEGAEGADGDG